MEVAMASNIHAAHAVLERGVTFSLKKWGWKPAAAGAVVAANVVTRGGRGGLAV